MTGILLIAENAEIIRSFTAMLSPAYSVYSVMSEQEGIDILKKDYRGIAAVLIELGPARKSGYIFSNYMQSASSFSHIPVIAISGPQPSEMDMDCFGHGFFDLITTGTPQALVHKRIANAIRAKDSLLLSEVEKMLKKLPACIFLKDTEGKYVFSTQTWRHLDTGDDPNWTIRGKTDLDIRKDKDNALKAMEADRRILETGVGTEYVIEENQDGIQEYLQLIKRPVYDENGKVTGIIALINNITDYQRLKLELEKRVKTDSDMITAMAADYRSIYYADLDKDECLCVRASSKQDSHMWEGKEFPFLQGFTEYAEHCVAEADRAAFLEFIDPGRIRAGLENEAMISHRYRSIRSGEERYEMLRIAGVRLIEERDDHMVHAIAAGFTDVDRETREQMEQNRALAVALSRAEEASAAKTAFLSSMSHEMRTPMNAIIGLGSIALRDQGIPAETRDALEKIGSSARHLLSIINDILDMSRIESDRMELKNEEFSFGDLFDQIRVIINGQCEDKGLYFVCEKDEALEDRFLGDDLRLKQVMINILGNAVKFTDAPGTVTFRVDQSPLSDDSRMLRFVIKDTGIGMDASYIPRLFEPFSQEDATTTNRYGGSGLGMAITKNMIDLMGGTIEVESIKGQGSTFTVSIPLHIPLQPAVQEEAAAAEQDSVPAVSLEGIHVLIAEDMELNADILADLLEMEDISSEWARNGRYAVEMFENNEEGHFAAILMDMRMPVMDGVEAARAIRKLDRPDAGKIPIIALTANAFEEDVKQCLEAGMDAHLSKPMDIEKLKAVLGRILAAREAAAQTTEKPSVHTLKD